jgi:hypothetical protein
VPEWTIGAVSKTVVAFWATVGSNPTLSAGSKNHLVAEITLDRRTAVRLVTGLSKIKGDTSGVNATPGITQLRLGDLIS